jgi:hypothetical protein
MLGDLFAVFYYKHFTGVISDGLLTLRFTELDCTGPVMKTEEDNEKWKHAYAWCFESW